MSATIEACRICGNRELVTVLDLGRQCLTGVFPARRDEVVPSAPLELVKCHSSDGRPVCGLLQLRHTCDLHAMYGMNYGYRSGLNQWMVNHLYGKVDAILDRIPLAAGDVVVDIGSNDGTLLGRYPSGLGLRLVGIDPTGPKFRAYYPDHVELLPDFFSAELYRKHFGGRRAKVVTSVAMLYDLENPIGFMREVHDVLADDGIWVFEQSYLPAMLQMNSYDTVCHEHLEYYGLRQIAWMTEAAGFDILDVTFNGSNGGSFSVCVVKKGGTGCDATGLVADLIEREEATGLATLAPYHAFAASAVEHRRILTEHIRGFAASGRTILGYGASTKGNVILQYCGITERDIPGIADVNEDKFGRFTPGSRIPIVPESEAKRIPPDCFLVLPWHFREAIVARERDYLAAGGKLLFPLPHVEEFPA